jgi:hypothetical protein
MSAFLAMRAGALATAVAAVSLAAVAGAQAPAMTVLAGPGRPSTLLAEHLQTTPEDFVVVDIGLWVDALVGDALGGAWYLLERDRAELLNLLLYELCERLPPPRGAADVLAGVAHTACTLLANDAARALALPEPWLAEIAAVVNGRRAPRVWGHERGDVDWSDALPNGGYIAERLQPLFRATVYLRRSLGAFDAEQAAAWQRAVDAVLAGETFAEVRGARLHQIDAALRGLLGTVPGIMPAVLGDLPAENGADRARLRTASGAWWERLAAVHAEEPAAGQDLRSAVLRVAHTLATEDPEDDWLLGWGRENWRGTWRDLADYAYVAVREVDVLAGVLCIGPDAKRPRLLVEPLPRSFAALQAAFRAADPVWESLQDARISGEFCAELDDCLALLAHQRAATEPPTELTERVWQRLLHGFDEQRDSRVETRLEGIHGPLRRTGCELVRVPIRWRGEDTTAVTFHWCVEQRGPDGVWRRAARTAR